MTPAEQDEVRELLEELYRRKQLECPGYIRDLHDHQAAFLADPARFKTARCGRRSGKTEMAIRGTFHAAELNPDSTIAYMAITRENAKRLFWAPAQRLARRYGIDCKFNKVELTIYFPNGSEIWLLGADQEADIEKVRGPHYRVFVLDEAASYRPFIASLIRDGVEPALGDVRGQLWLLGSPGRLTTGYFYECDQHPMGARAKFANHHWNVLGNPFFPDARGWLDETLSENGWTEHAPIYRREYLGEWVKDDSFQVYRFDEDRNHIARLPEQDTAYRYVLGLDFGVRDATAFAVWAYHPHDPNGYLVECYKKARMSVMDVAEHVVLMVDRYAALSGNPNGFERIVGDTGGMGKAHQLTFEQRYGIYVEPAKKTEKWAFIDHMNAELDSGRIRVVSDACRDVIDEWSSLEWETTIGPDGREIPKRDRYSEALDDDAADAALYAWRLLLNYRATRRSAPLKPGTSRYWNAVEEAQIRREMMAEQIRAGALDPEEAEPTTQWWERTL